MGRSLANGIRTGAAMDGDGDIPDGDGATDTMVDTGAAEDPGAGDVGHGTADGGKSHGNT